VTPPPTTKEAQRAELHKTIWRIANDLRGSVDGWGFKADVLGMLFYRYISENLAAHFERAEHASGDVDFSYAAVDDVDADGLREVTVLDKGFFILPSELFINVCATARHDDNLNETLDRVFETSRARQSARRASQISRGSSPTSA
jgi:type I restriction enzyme M protein